MQISKKEMYGMNSKGDYSRSYEASPIYAFKNSSLASTKEWLIDIESREPSSKNYGVMDNIQIQNLSSQTIYFYPNQDRTKAKVIPAGGIITFTKTTIPAIRSLIIYNAGTSTITANQIEISVWKEGVVFDDMVRKMHKSFFTKVLGFRG